VEALKILLDTNAYTGLLGGDRGVLRALGAADTVYLSVIVLGELYAGFRGGRKERENRGRLEAFLAKPTVKILHATRETAELFGTVKDTLRRAGRPIPTNDVWIAAQALETGSRLVTTDAHFREIPGLILHGAP
jgi:tRNA(fMet)-specific endonuclease VapC